MKKISLIFSIFLFVLPFKCFAATYSIDPVHSKVMFKVKHLGISTVTGYFKSFSGKYEFDPKAIENSKVEAEIDTASIDTNHEKRDNHLRSPDFFNVEKFPKMTYKSRKIVDIKGNSFTVIGDLTLLGNTREVPLKVEFGGTVKDPWGNERSAFVATTRINRKDFGMTWNKVLDNGGLVVGDEVDIILEIEGIKEKGE